MKTASDMMTNATLTDEQYKYIKAEAVRAARSKIHARDYINVKPIGSIGKQTFSYDTYAEFSEADLVWSFKDFPDVPKVTRSNVNIPILEKTFRIAERDYIASQTYGEPLETNSIDNASYQVARLENTFIVQGYSADGTNYNINGLYQSANNSYTTSKAFSTAGNALVAVGAGIKLLDADGIDGPYDLVVNGEQYYELAASYLGSGAGKSEMDAVRNLIGGEVYKETAMTAGTGMLIPSKSGSRGYFELVETQPLETEVERLSKRQGGGIWGITYECIVPVVYDTDAICKLTQI